MAVRETAVSMPVGLEIILGLLQQELTLLEQANCSSAGPDPQAHILHHLMQLRKKMPAGASRLQRSRKKINSKICAAIMFSSSSTDEALLVVPARPARHRSKRRGRGGESGENLDNP